jgi:fructokinase
VVTRCGVWPLGGAEIVDTTGAGDAFIAGMIYGLARRHSAPRTLNVAAFVACQKLKGPGARAALPQRNAVPPELL